MLKLIIPKFDGTGSEGLLLKRAEGICILFYGSASKALSDVGLNLFLTMESYGVLDAFNEVVDVLDVGVRANLDDISLA